MKVVFFYVSREGQTKKIAQYMVDLLREQGLSVEIYSIEDEEIGMLSMSDYDCFVLGSSVRYGKHHSCFLEFVKKNINILHNRRSFFYSVNLIARKAHRNTAKTNPYVCKFLRISYWNPLEIGVFPGAVYYSKYNFFNKYIIKIIMKITKGELKKDIEYTSWEQVDDFTNKILTRIKVVA